MGLEAAHHARRLGLAVRVYERAPHAAGHVRAWGHVRLFTPWTLLLGPFSCAALTREPAHDACPTGAEFAHEYLDPVARALGDVMRVSTEVVAIGRDGVLKSDFTRAGAPFRLLLRDAHGREWTENADAVIDASGVYSTPRWAGDGGIPAPGECALGARVTYAIPDVLGADRALFAGARTLLVGAGASAATTASALSALGNTHIVWVTRAPREALYAPDASDPLPERVALYARARAIARDTEHIGSARVQRFESDERSVRAVIATPEGERVVDVDRVVVHAGFGPDNSIYRELQVHECYASRGPMALSSALLGAAAADCLTTPAFGADLLANPEPNFYILGHKSYGTSPHFLLQTGYAQVADVVPHLAASSAE